MDVSVNWLRALVPGLEGSAQELADRISLGAIPVDRVIPVGDDLAGIVIARVTEARPHPNADRLTLCRVDAGTGEPIDVVCGAPNVEEGALYPYVAPGQELPGGFRIESRKIRGEMSHGMLCSEKELELGRDAGGIMKLEGNFEPGASFASAMSLPDARLELDLTPNRIDLACHAGVARELAPEGGTGVVLTEFPGPGWEPVWIDGRTGAESNGVSIRIADADRCFRYLGAIIRGVRVGPSPAWLQARLRGAGARPINNVVDATNYILLESNQPLHAFDLEKLAGSGIQVRAARAGEELRTLDGEKHVLTPACTVIADEDGAIALAGVMGGQESEVSPETVDLLIECAAFDPTHTRHTAAETGLATDASYRFERGIDEVGLEAALTRCVQLILAIAGGEADTEGIRVGGLPPSLAVAELRPERVRQVLGLDLSSARIEELLSPLGFGLRSDGTRELLRFDVPGWRGDVRTESDLLEEVARRHGYDAFPSEPRSFRPSSVPDAPDHERGDRVRRFFAGEGFLEARSLPFVTERRSAVDRIPLLRPLSRAEGFLRTDLASVLLSRVEHNWLRGRRSVRLFEVGTAFGSRSPRPEAPPADPSPDERDAANPFAEERRFAFVITGDRSPDHWEGSASEVDLWDLKGIVEQLAETFDLGPVAPFAGRVDECQRPFGWGMWLHDEAFEVGDGECLAGIAGRVDSRALDAPPWASPVFAGEFRLGAVQVADRRRFEPLPQYPAVARDLAFTLASTVPASEVESAIRLAAPPLLSNLQLFDVYEGEGVEEGRRSLAWRLVFRAPDRTLTDGEVDEAMTAILRRLEADFDVRIRAS
ncbi:MAG: phenylalanine--tRNA ligase subunit beta [marine benthic group bacterium]|nr:phenylalanine--tRNA ligase subunit beta [Gemmatimonadota bacterium]